MYVNKDSAYENERPLFIFREFFAQLFFSYNFFVHANSRKRLDRFLWNFEIWCIVATYLNLIGIFFHWWRHFWLWDLAFSDFQMVGLSTDLLLNHWR